MGGSAHCQPLATWPLLVRFRIDDRCSLLIDLNRLGPVEIRTCDGSLVLKNLLDATLSDNRPSQRTCPGPKIPNRIGTSYHVAIVLYNQQRISQIPQLMHRADQFFIVPRMKPNRGLIQYIQHPAQSCSELTGKSNPLRLATRECVRRSPERQIIQSNIDQKSKALENLTS